MQAKAGFVRFWGAVLALTLVAASPVARAQSPELYQLLSDIKGDIQTLNTPITNPVCLPAMVDMAKQGIQAMQLSTALGKVVVEPLEQGAKVGLGALGAGAAVTTYSMMKCAITASSPREFAICMLGEGAGAGLGAGLGNAGVGELPSAVAGWAWDQAFDSAKGAWDAYGATSEDVEFEAGGECKITVHVNWNKRRRPGAEGGMIFISVRAEGCKCSTGSSLKSGSLRVNVPIRYTRGGNGQQPGFSVGTLQDLRVEATCCGNPGTDPNVFLLSPAGALTGVVRPQTDVPPPTSKPPRTPTGSGAPPTTTTGPPPPPSTPPPPPPVTPKPKPQPVWPPADADLPAVCPECNVYLETIQKLRTEIARLQQRQTQLQADLEAARRAKASAEADIRRATAELNIQEGTGGSAFDRDTGLTTEAYTMADGRVRIRVMRGNEVIEESFRERRDTAAAKKLLDDAEQRLKQAQADEARLNTAIGNARAEQARAEAAIRTQEALYEECIERCRRKVLFGEPAMSVAITVPLEFSGGVGSALAGGPTTPGGGAAGGITGKPAPAPQPLTQQELTDPKACPPCSAFLDDLELTRNRIRSAEQAVERAKAAIEAGSWERYRELESKQRGPGAFPPLKGLIGEPTPQESLDRANRQLSNERFNEARALRNLEDCVRQRCRPQPTIGSMLDAQAGDSFIAICPQCADIAKMIAAQETLIRNLEHDQNLDEGRLDVARRRISYDSATEHARLTGREYYDAGEQAYYELERSLKPTMDARERLIAQYQRRVRELLAELKRCAEERCKNAFACVVEVERVINVVGNNPFDSRDPLRESNSSSSSSSSSSAPSVCSTTLSPRTFLSCFPNGCSLSTPFSSTVSGGTVTLNPFNSGVPANGPVQFCNGTSVSNNLNILGAPAHQCTISSVGASLVIQCQNNFGAGPGSCSSFCP